MNKRTTIILIIFIVIIVIIGIVLSLFFKKIKHTDFSNAKMEINIEDVNNIPEKENNGLKISEVEFEKRKNDTILSIRITNTYDFDITNNTSYKIVLYDEEKNEIHNINSYFSPLKAHESLVLSSMMDKKCQNAKSFVFTVVGKQ